MIKIEEKHKALLNTERLCDKNTYKEVASAFLKEVKKMKLIFNSKNNIDNLEDLVCIIGNYNGFYGRYEYLKTEIYFDAENNAMFPLIYINDNNEVNNITLDFQQRYFKVYLFNKKYFVNKNNIITKFILNKIDENSFLDLYIKDLIKLNLKFKNEIDKTLLNTNIEEKNIYTTEKNILLFMDQQLLYQLFSSNKNNVSKNYVESPKDLFNILDIDFITLPELKEVKSTLHFFNNLLYTEKNTNKETHIDDITEVDLLFKQFKNQYQINIKSLIFLLDTIRNYFYFYTNDSIIQKRKLSLFLKKIFDELVKKKLFDFKNIKPVLKYNATKAFRYFDKNLTDDEIHIINVFLDRGSFLKFLLTNQYLNHLDIDNIIDDDTSNRTTKDVYIKNIERYFDKKEMYNLSKIFKKILSLNYDHIYILFDYQTHISKRNQIKMFFNEIDMNILFMNEKINIQNLLDKLIFVDYKNNEEEYNEIYKNKVFL